MIGRKFKGIPKTRQAGIERMELPWTDKVETSLGRITATYPERMTCDIETSNGAVQNNVPVLAHGGLEVDKVWGTLELPSVDSYCVIGFIEGRESFPFILGTFYAYAHNLFQSKQVPVNSGNKTKTLKLLENISDKVYRKIFKSGTTIEVKDDGTIQVETPSGTLLEIDESDSGTVTISANGNTLVMGSSSVLINGNLEILQ